MDTLNISLKKNAFNDIYFPLLNCKKRYLHLYGGAGSGKSYFTAQRFIWNILEGNVKTLLVVRKVGRTIRNSCFALLRSVINKWGLSDYFSIVDSRLEITCKLNGATIICSGLDDNQKMKSIHAVTHIWVEEATEITAQDFDQLDLRLRGDFAPYFQMVLTYNPINFYHWLKKDFHDKSYSIAKDGRGKINESTVILQTTYRDNLKFLDKNFVSVTLQRLKEKDPLYFAVYGEGIWVLPEGLIYPKFTTIKRLENIAFYGLDFGYNNPCVLAGCNFIEEERVQVHEVFYKTGLITKDIIRELKENEVNRKTPIYADAANPDKIKEIKDAGFNIVPASKNVIDGINYVKGFDIEITESSVNGIKEFSLYKYQTVKGELTENPVKMYDHFCDAIRYGILSHGKIYGTKGRRGGAIKPTRKRGLIH